MLFFDSVETIPQMLARRARENGSHVYCTFADQVLTITELERRSTRIANALFAAGFQKGDRICIMLPNSIEHVLLFFGCIKAGLVQVPVNVKHTGASLSFLLQHSDPKGVIATHEVASQLLPALAERPLPVTIWLGSLPDGANDQMTFEDLVAAENDTPLTSLPAPADLLFLTYTSGTTGMPKGVMVTEKMVRGTALGCILVASPEPGDVFYLWEPFYHVTGSETLVLGIMREVTLALAERFSASRFWSDCRRVGATHIHYVGGVLQILLRQPPGPEDRDHKVRIAWGGGCPVQTWSLFEERYGIELREGYGMTETSSFCTMNLDRKIGSVGTNIPWFDVRISKFEGEDDADALEEGQIVVRALEPGMNTRGYFNNPEASVALFKGEWLQTGDRGYRDEDGHIIFKGRIKDSVRRRGENVSAWEVERVINGHPLVEESALIGVVNELGDEDLKIFIRVTEGASLQPQELFSWCDGKMPSFQIPRFIAFTEMFSRTPSERIRKAELSRSTSDCWDSEAGRRRT